MDPLSVLRPQGVLMVALCLSVIPFSSGCGRAMTAQPVSESLDGQKSAQANLRQPGVQAGIYHRLEEGQTLSTLSRAYQVPVSRLLQVNGINDPTGIPTHTPIFIPGATRVLSVARGITPALIWPLKGRVTSGFSAGGGKRRHEGIDIDGDFGQPIRAAAAGRVLLAGTDGRYGKAVLIDHGGGLVTFYAHASRLMVRTGEWVAQGEPIAEVGRSGNARGTHLHFEARRNGRPVNPLRLLRDGAAFTAASR